MKNVGSIDRIVRVTLGLALIATAVVGGWRWGWVGVVPLATALLGWCPLYTLTGVRTCPVGGRR